MLLLAALTLAARAGAGDWDDGRAAFQSGDYAAALAHFESFRDAGATGTAVHYNIAVCQYELGRYAQARETFRFIADTYPKMAALAQYNLGLVARRLGEPAVAAGHFLEAYRLAGDDRTLRVLASDQLADVAPGLERRAAWVGVLAARAGYDDNVALRDPSDLPLGATTESAVLDLFAAVDGPLPAGPDGLRVDAAAYVIRYPDADRFDQHGATAGLRHDWRRGDWRIRARAGASASWLGGDAFDRRLDASVELARSAGRQGSASVTWRFDEIRAGDAVFDGIEGQRYALDLGYRWHADDANRLRVRLRHAIDDRADGGVSPTRTGLTVDYRNRPESGWGYETEIAYRRSRFDDAAVPRTEKLAELAVALTRPLARDWLLVAEARWSDNEATDPVFTYDRRAVTVGVTRTF